MEEREFNKIYANHKEQVKKFVLRLVKNSEISEEIVDDVFVKVYQNFKSFDDTKSKLTTWIINIAKNTVYDHFRAIKLEKTSKYNFLDSKEQTDVIYNLNSDYKTDDDIIYSESIMVIKKTIEKLDANMQEIAELRYFKQLQYSEIAEKLNIPMGTVKTNLNRIKTFLVKNTELV